MISRRKLLDAQNKDKIIYYDYIAYKRAAGWLSGIYEDDWYRPLNIKRAKYFAEFINKLPECYFMGNDVKDLIKTMHSKNISSISSLALSLCFDEFEICTCNLKMSMESIVNEYLHTYLVLKIDEKKYVVDTEYGLITDENTYKDVFGIEDEIHISSNEFKKTNIYKYLIENSYKKAPSYEDEINETNEYFLYKNKNDSFIKMCKEFKSSSNIKLNKFINNILYNSLKTEFITNIRSNIYLNFGNSKVEYPKNNMISIIDDEIDNTLYGRTTDAIANNEKVLNNYHKYDTKDNKYFNNINLKLSNIVKRINISLF